MFFSMHFVFCLEYAPRLGQCSLETQVAQCSGHPMTQKHMLWHVFRFLGSLTCVGDQVQSYLTPGVQWVCGVLARPPLGLPVSKLLWVAGEASRGYRNVHFGAHFTFLL
jgi:hypothetical protein